MLVVIAILFSIPGIIAGVTTLNPGTQDVELKNIPDWYWILQGISTIVSMIFSLFIFTMLALQYLNLDERTESSVGKV